MTFPLEYHKDVKSRVERSIPAALALCGMLLLPLLLVSSSPAQVNNGAASTHASAAIPSVAPVRNIAVPDKAIVIVPPKPHPPQPPIHYPNGNNGNQHNPSNRIAYYPYFYPVPYAVDGGAADADTTDASAPNADATDAANDSGSDNDPEYQGGPTIFDRRGPGAASYRAVASPTQSSAEQARVEDDEAADSGPEPPQARTILVFKDGHQLDRRGPGAASYRAVASPTQSSAEQARVEDDEAADSGPEPPQARTILVFKDGHQLEVANYAIVTPTLYDLTPGHPRKIALSDLDLPATEKLNDDHGIVFELPPSAQAN